MKYLLLIYESEEFNQVKNAPEMQAAGAKYGQSLHAAGVLVSGAGLAPVENAKLVSTEGEETQVYDGPFTETKEMVGGFVVLNVPDEKTAIDWAAQHPAAQYSKIEVREILFGG